MISPDEAIATATRVGAVGAAHGDESERDRRLAASVVDALEASGLWALMAPSALGGSAAPPTTMVEVIAELARHDASTGWCAGIGMGTNYMSGLISETAAKNIFTNVNRGGAGPFAPGGRGEVVDDGYRVTGRWPFSSNCQQATFASCGFIGFADGRPADVGPDGMPKFALAFLSRDQFDIDETWNTVGMRGTGSHDIVATDATISREQTATMQDAMWPDDASFRLRAFDVLGACLSSVLLGIGRAALDMVAAKVVADDAGPPIFGPRGKLGDDVHAQLEIARAETRLRAATGLLLDALDTAYGHALRGDTPPRVATALIGMANCETLLAAHQAVSTAGQVLGSSAVREGAAFDRLRRDLDTAGTHIMFRPAMAAGLARELAGVPTAVFPYLPAPDESV